MIPPTLLWKTAPVKIIAKIIYRKQFFEYIQYIQKIREPNGKFVFKFRPVTTRQ